MITLHTGNILHHMSAGSKGCAVVSFPEDISLKQPESLADLLGLRMSATPAQMEVSSDGRIEVSPKCVGTTNSAGTQYYGLCYPSYVRATTGLVNENTNALAWSSIISHRPHPMTVWGEEINADREVYWLGSSKGDPEVYKGLDDIYLEFPPQEDSLKLSKLQAFFKDGTQSVLNGNTIYITGEDSKGNAIPGVTTTISNITSNGVNLGDVRKLKINLTRQTNNWTRLRLEFDRVASPPRKDKIKSSMLVFAPSKDIYLGIILDESEVDYTSLGLKYSTAELFMPSGFALKISPQLTLVTE